MSSGLTGSHHAGECLRLVSASAASLISLSSAGGAVSGVFGTSSGTRPKMISGTVLSGALSSSSFSGVLGLLFSLSISSAL